MGALNVNETWSDEASQPYPGRDGSKTDGGREQQAIAASAAEWDELVTELAGIHLNLSRPPKLQPVRSSSDHMLLVRRKRGHPSDHNVACGTTSAPPQGGGGSCPLSSEEEEDLGAPPVIMPTLKRARAYSSSSKARKFSDNDNTPRQ